MKYFLVFLFLGVSAHAGTCDQISGFFKTTTAECKYSHDGVKFYNDGHKSVGISYDSNNKNLTIEMGRPNNPFTLIYLANGQPQNGRPMFEGDIYTATCSNNRIFIRAEMPQLKYPLIYEFEIQSDGSLSYRESFDGSTFVRFCEMNRQ